MITYPPFDMIFLIWQIGLFPDVDCEIEECFRDEVVYLGTYISESARPIKPVPLITTIEDFVLGRVAAQDFVLLGTLI